MSAGLTFLGIVLGLILVGSFTYFMILRYKEEEETTDDTIFHCLMPQYSRGHAVGTIIKTIQGKKRIGILFMPKDLDHVRLLKNKEKVIIKPILIWFDPKNLIIMPKGTWSSQRSIIWGIPPNVENLPEIFKKNQLSLGLIQSINNSDLERTEIGLIREGSIRKDWIIKRMGDGEWTKQLFEQMEEQYNQKIKTLTKQEDRKSGLFPSVPTHNYMNPS